MVFRYRINPIAIPVERSLVEGSIKHGLIA